MIFQISPKLSVARDLPQTYGQTVPQTRPCNSKASITKSAVVCSSCNVKYCNLLRQRKNTCSSARTHYWPMTLIVVNALLMMRTTYNARKMLTLHHHHEQLLQLCAEFMSDIERTVTSETTVCCRVTSTRCHCLDRCLTDWQQVTDVSLTTLTTQWHVSSSSSNTCQRRHRDVTQW